MKNGKRIVLEASEGITFRVQEGADEIVIEAINKEKNLVHNEKKCLVYSDNYKKPYIPEGYVHLEGTWDTGFVIQNKADKSEFVWIPVGWLNADSTLDGNHFDEKFGRMNWYNYDFSQSGYHEETNRDLLVSVKKHGGFYFARYHASKQDGKPVFKKGNMPWVNINYHDAETAAARYAKGSKDVVSQITSGAAFDSVLRWIIKSNAKTYEEVVNNSTSWGNYWNSQNSPRKVLPTGNNEKWCALGIYDLAGNVDEWTSEQYKDSCRVLRGGHYYGMGFIRPTAVRGNFCPSHNYYVTSFRAVLYKK